MSKLPVSSKVEYTLLSSSKVFFPKRAFYDMVNKEALELITYDTFSKVLIQEFADGSTKTIKLGNEYTIMLENSCLYSTSIKSEITNATPFVIKNLDRKLSAFNRYIKNVPQEKITEKTLDDNMIQIATPFAYNNATVVTP